MKILLLLLIPFFGLAQPKTVKVQGGSNVLGTAITANQIPYGNGTGVISSGYFVYDPVTGHMELNGDSSTLRYPYIAFKNLDESGGPIKFNITADLQTGAGYFDFASGSGGTLNFRSTVGGGNTVWTFSGVNGAIYSKSLDDGTGFGKQAVWTNGVPSLVSTVETIATLSYSSTRSLDFATSTVSENLTLAGNITFTSSNLAAGRSKVVFITADGSSRTLTFPGGWVFIGAAAPTAIAAGKVAVLSLYSRTGADSGVVASYSVQP